MAVAADRSKAATEAAKLFSMGCDARLRGERLRDDAPTMFERGWLNVDSEWGIKA